MRLSGAAKRQSTVGQIVNLMSVDAQKVQDFFLYLSLMWYVPLLIAVDLYFMWQQLGPSCLAGFAVLCLVVPINGVYFARVAMNLQVSPNFQSKNVNFSQWFCYKEKFVLCHIYFRYNHKFKTIVFTILSAIRGGIFHHSETIICSVSLFENVIYSSDDAQ